MTIALNKPMELEGSLRTFHLPDILRFLAMGRLTGTLSLASGERKVELLIHNGRLVGTSSQERFIRLGQLLVYNGLLTRKDLVETLEQQKLAGGDQLLGELLIERRLVTSEQVQQALLLQMKEELWELFTWSDGKFNFEHGSPTTIKRTLAEIEIEPLLAEGMARLEQWQALTRTIGDGADIYQARGDLNTMPEVRLSPSEWRVLGLINGRTTVQSLVLLSGLGRFETFCAIDKLQQLQLIEGAACHQGHYSNSFGKKSGEIKIVPLRPENPKRRDEPLDHENGLFSRLTRRKRGAQSEHSAESARSFDFSDDGTSRHFLTAVGWACALLNRLFDCLAKESGETIDIADIWAEMYARHPKADLVHVVASTLDASEFDSFVCQADGINSALLGAFEESMAALAGFGSELLAKSRQSLGGRADQFATEVMRPYLDHMDIKYPGDFLARAWTEKLKAGN